MKGLEPSTFCMASRRSSQLSYIREGTQYRSAVCAARALPSVLRSGLARPPDVPGAALADRGKPRWVGGQLPVGGVAVVGGPPDMSGQ
jgi:hypothetical protein